MKASLIAIVLVLSALAITNPGREEYLDWVQHQDQTDALASMMMSLARPFVDADTKAENFTLFTVFTTSIDQTHKSFTLGFLHHFYGVPSVAGSWHPGERSPTYPHVVAAQARDQWLPEAGYRWINEPPPSGDFRVKWVPGLAEEALPHVVTAAAEGQWLPEDGYQWVTLPPKPGDLRVRWMPGQRSASHEHVLAAPQEERWLPEQGFAWIANPPAPGDLRVRRTAPNDDPTEVRKKTAEAKTGDGGLCWSVGHCTVCSDANIAEGCGSGYTKDDLRAWDQEMRRVHYWGYVNSLEKDTIAETVRGRNTGPDVVPNLSIHECNRLCISWQLPIYASAKLACERAFPDLKPLRFEAPSQGRCAGEKRPQMIVNGRWVDD